MTLEQLRASLREKHGALPALRDKAMADGAPQTDFDAYEQAVKDLEDVEAKIALLERDEQISAKASKAADAVIVRDQTGSGVEPTVRQSNPEDILARTAASIVVGRSIGKHPLKVLEDEGYGQLAASLRQKAVNTLVSAEGGILVPTPLTGGIMPLLRTASTFLDANPVRVPLTNGQFVLPRGLAGATAGYVAEAALKPVSSPTFDSVSMRAKKLAGIVPITNEARMWTVGDIEAYVRQDLQAALAVTLDLNAWLGTGSGSSPLGILNKVGVQTVTGTFASATAPTLAELETFATAMILKLTTANIYANNRWRWVMSYRTAMKLASMRVGAGTDGAYAFPDMDLGRAGGPMWKGFPVIVTSQIPTNGGGTTDETTIALVDFNYVLFGEEEGITMKMSDQATLNTTGATNGTGLVHLWQQNMFAILAEAMHDFGLRSVLAVVKATIRF